MKKIYLLGAAFLISLGITGCTPATTATPPASKPASTVEQQEKEVSLTIYRPTEDAMYLVPATEELFTAMTVNTLTEFPDIKEVKFLMNGKAITHLSGHSDMTRTFKRMNTIIKK